MFYQCPGALVGKHPQQPFLQRGFQSQIDKSRPGDLRTFAKILNRQNRNDLLGQLPWIDSDLFGRRHDSIGLIISKLGTFRGATSAGQTSRPVAVRSDWLILSSKICTKLFIYGIFNRQSANAWRLPTAFPGYNTHETPNQIDAPPR